MQPHTDVHRERRRPHVHPDGTIRCLACGHLNDTRELETLWIDNVQTRLACRGCRAPIADLTGAPIPVIVTAARTVYDGADEYGYCPTTGPKRCVQCCGWHYRMLPPPSPRLNRSPELVPHLAPENRRPPVTYDHRHRRRYWMWPFTFEQVHNEGADEGAARMIEVAPRATVDTLCNAVPWGGMASEHGLSAVVDGLEELLRGEVWRHGVADGAHIYIASAAARAVYRITSRRDLADPEGLFPRRERSTGTLHVRVQGFFPQRFPRDARTGRQLLAHLETAVATFAGAAPPTALMLDGQPLDLSRPLVETTLDSQELVVCWGSSRTPAPRHAEKQ